jgi:ApbE superfamily uncharacterized protein (UPF0280 family)
LVGGPQRGWLPGGRLHLQHGPIDLVIEAFGEAGEVARAYEQAAAAFEGLLARLVEELPVLRSRVGKRKPKVRGPVARRMAEAVWPHRAVFVTPMAAVAGAVADEILAALAAGPDLRKAYVNDGGDIALHLTPGQSFRAGIVADLAAPAIDGVATIGAETTVRGIATSGRGGRSLSRGIADAVTVLARDAAAADVAATLIANAVNIDHPAIRRRPAREAVHDSDLGHLLVTVEVGALPAEAVAAALDAGAAEAERMRAAGLIEAAVLLLRGEHRVVGKERIHRNLGPSPAASGRGRGSSPKAMGG